MKKLSETRTDKKILIIGAGGTGKTHIIGTLCEVMPTLVVTADENGLETLKTQGVEPAGVIILSNWQDCWADYKEIVGMQGKAQAIALDHLGATQEIIQDKIILTPRKWEENTFNRNRAAAEATYKREIMLGERRLAQDQWGSMWLGLDAFLNAILSLNFAVKLVTVLESVAENPRDGQEHVYPNLQKAMRLSISAKFGLVANSFIGSQGEDTYFALTCRSHPRIETKSRYGPGRTWENPTALSLLGYMNRKGGEESEIEKKLGVGL